MRRCFYGITGWFVCAMLLLSVFSQDVHAAKKRKLSPEQLRLRNVKIRIRNQRPVAIIDPADENPTAKVVVNNTNKEAVKVKIAWSFASYGGTPVEVNLPQELELAAGEKVEFPLPASGLYADCWQLDYTINDGGVSYSDKTYIVVMKIHDRKLPGKDGPHFGVALGLHGDNKRIDKLFWATKAMGATMPRMDFFWQEIEPRQGVSNFRRYDWVIERMKNYNFEPQVLLCYNARWSAPEKLAKSRNASDWKFYPPNIEHWKEYVQKTVSRYKDSVRFWEVLNEADLWNFWHGTPQQYGELLKVSYKVIHENDPEAYVMTSGFATLLPHSGRRHMNLQKK